ncbi:MAG: methylated-DNA--[protein]-cysteine S-methyltransferase [Rhizobacter sp.]|nr:methylated-DNA--[protein]-cysteine S-methyltransferase [Rhizobacter sp.]
MTPTQSIAQRCTAQAHLPSPLGPILLARTQAGLAGAWFEDQKWHPSELDAPEQPEDPLLQQAATQINEYFAGDRTHFELPLDLQGTPFQQAVWRALCAIDAGITESYATVARRIGAPQAVRAVGAAVGRNPVSVIVPCHRVVGADGSLTGYAGGLERKRALLTLEGAL